MRSEISRDPNKSLEIMEAFGVGPNYIISEEYKRPCTIAGHAFDVLINNSDSEFLFRFFNRIFVRENCNTSLVKIIMNLDEDVDIDKNTGSLFNKSKSVRDVIMDRLDGFYKGSPDHSRCAKKLLVLLKNCKNRKNKTVE